MAPKKKSFKNPESAFITDPKITEAPAEEKKPSVYDLEIPEGFKIVKETKSARLQLLVRPTILNGLKTQAAVLGTSTNDLCDKIFSDFLNMES